MSVFEQPKPVAGLVVQNISKVYDAPGGELTVLKDASFTLSPGRTLAITGPSGSGKSTLLNIIGSLDGCTSGTVLLDEMPVNALKGEDLAEFRSTRVGFVFQDHHLLPQCTALENVLLPTLALKHVRDEPELARALIERVGLGGRMDHLPSELSGGERQRVAIARALVNGAPLILCDEPTGNLDTETGRGIADLFVELARERNRMLVVVTHDLALAARFDRVLELRQGVLTEPDEAERSPL